MMLGGRIAEWSGASSAPTAADYVQDGLIAMWDGIENADWGTHDASSAVWKDLVGGIELPILSGGTWGVSCLDTDGSNLAVQQYSNALKAVFDKMRHFQAVFSAPFTQYDSSRILIHYRESLQVGKLICGCSRSPGVTRMGINSALDMNVTDVAVSYACSSYPNIGTVDGVWANGVSVATAGAYSIGEFGNGISMGGGNNNGSSTKCAGRVYCLRIYNRALTASEIAANYAIDQQRFNLGGAS